MSRGIKSKKPGLVGQIVLLISIVVCASMALAGTVFTVIIDDIMHRYIGQQAMTVARLAAANETIIRAFDDPDPVRLIQPVAEKIRLETGASYVVIGNRDGIRYSHYDPEQIGKLMGTSNDPVFLEHRSVIYKGTGISGPAIKAKAPIYNARGELVGVSSVGYLYDDIEETIESYKDKIIHLSLLLLAGGILVAYFIARRVKALILGLEPEEISFLFKEKEATFESIRDAIVAVDTQEKIVSMNKRARELFHDQQMTIGAKLQQAQLKEAMRTVIESAQVQSNQRIFLGSEVYLMHAAPIMQQGRVRGVAFTFRTASEIGQLTDEVSKIKSFSDHMRAQNQEYLNKLNTIHGLLVLERYEQAIELISDEVRERQDVIAFLMDSVKEPLVAACLLGKINRSKELKVRLEIDPDSHLTRILPETDAKALVTILGNIIDNGMEAARDNKGADAQVKVSFTDFGNDLIFDIEDNGPGISKDKQQTIFVQGFSTKPGDHRGLGLAIVKHALLTVKGQIFIDRSPLGGSRFTIVIPK